MRKRRIKTPEQKSVENDFLRKDDIWRIEAVIHDGSWYTLEKWAKVAKVKEEVLLNWIKLNAEHLVRLDGSYRVGYNEVVNWYKKNNIPITEEIVPNNFPPKLWGGKTEVEAFLENPRRRVGSVSFNSTNKALTTKVENILSGTAKVYMDKTGQSKAYGLSATYIKELLTRSLTKQEIKELDMKTRSLMFKREIIDFNEMWLAESLEFYISYARGILESNMSTLEIYLPEESDRRAQIIFWIISAMKKFDESKPIPFSGYLAIVLPHWVFDLPNEHLGKDLSEFQRNKKRTIERLQQDGREGEIISIQELASEMGLELDKFIELNDRHETWILTKRTSSLVWEESSNEKAGRFVGVQQLEKRDYEKLYEISLSAVSSAIVTRDWNSAKYFISVIDNEDEYLINNASKHISNEYKLSLAENLKR